MSTRLFWNNSIKVDEIGSLKEIDPADSKGDGSDDALVASQDLSIVIDGTIIAFYALMESGGASDDGLKVIVPSKNPGNFWWKLCGYTNSEFPATAGDIFKCNLESEFVPDGFTIGSTIPYTDYLLRKLFNVNEILPDTSVYACGIWKNTLYAMLDDGTNSLKCNLLTNQITLIDADPDDWVWDQCPGWAPDSPRYIVDIDAWGAMGTPAVRIFDMETEEFSYRTPELLSEVATRHPGTKGPQSMGLYTKIYILGGITGSTTNFTAYRVDTDEFEYLAAVPTAMQKCVIAVDSNVLYCFDTETTGNGYEYDIKNDSWALMTSSAPITGTFGYGGIRDGKIYFCSTSKFHEYSITGDSWEEFSITYSGDPKKPSIYDKNYGLIIPGAGAGQVDIFQIPLKQPIKLVKS